MSKFKAMKAFFALVATDKELQKRLFSTDRIGEVADIAQECGFEVSAVDILRTQAGRSLLLPEHEQQMLAAGEKPLTGAQWGRNGRGYLDAPGYWILKLLEWDEFPPANEAAMEGFLVEVSANKALQDRLRDVESYNAVAAMATESGFDFSPLLLLKFMASQVLRMSDTRVELLVEGADGS